MASLQLNHNPDLNSNDDLCAETRQRAKIIEGFTSPFHAGASGREALPALQRFPCTQICTHIAAWSPVFLACVC